MKKYYLLVAILCLGVFATLYSCRKAKADLDSQEKQFNQDQSDYKNASDQTDNDVNNELSNYSAFGRLQQGASTLSSPMCGVQTIDTSLLASQKIIVFTFDGVTPCFSPSSTRSGQLKVQLLAGNHWTDANAVLQITYINYKITQLSNSHSIMFNGSKTLTNVNGSNWLTFLLGTSTFKFRERALNIAVTLSDGSNTANATWNSARLTEWSYTPSGAQVNFTSNGDTTLNGYSTVDSWGVNRFSQAFTTNFNSPWMSNSYCGFWRPTGGEFVHHVNGNTFTFTLGVDQSGVASSLQCAYGFKVAWASGNNTNSVVLSY